MADDISRGIVIEKIALNEADFENAEEAKQAHREDRHSFFLLESGTVHLEIDFQTYVIGPLSVVYMHPDQVHRIISFDHLIISSWAMNNESIDPEYLQLLEGLVPAQPMVLSRETFTLIAETVDLCIKFAERKSDKLYHSLLKNSCNALVALVISQYLETTKPADQSSRFEVLTKLFRQLLERNYTSHKRPATYAKQLNISTAYLNECVKNATGYSVSHHIQQRVILEAKRLLHHSGRSVKEIAAELGYEDYPYFSRLFAKVAGMPALAFRRKNRD